MKSNANTRSTAERANIQKAALAVGAVFLIVGILGFIPGITTNYDQLTIAGYDSQAMLMGVFQVSILHNTVHLIFGIFGIALARTPNASKHFLLWGGAIYLALWLYGLITDHDTAANFVPVNNADNWLHLVLGAGMIALALLLARARTGTSRSASPNRKNP